jgi:hypothetical protein
MQSENFDNKVREAAEQHHPNYDEKAWSKMEKLLDQHLPQKNDDRRRIVFLLLFALLLGGGAWLFISKPWQHENVAAGIVNAPDKNFVQSPSNPTKDNHLIAPQKNAGPTPAIDEPTAKPVTDGNKTVTPTNQPTDVAKQDVGKTSSQVKPARKNADADNLLTVDQTNPATVKQKTNAPVTNDNTTPVNNDKTVNVSAPVEKDKPVSTDAGKDAVVTTAAISENKQVEQSKQKPADAQKKPSEQKKSTSQTGPRKNSFFFSFSAGPDRSSVNLDHPGEVRLMVGAGAGFTFHDRWTIRTGFYSSDKVYTASKYDYKPDPPVINPNYLDEINANCKVYEIPLNVSYNFSKSDKSSFFATTGLSSFIMKKEEYQYLYKYPSNPPTTYTYTKTINNENKHYFSVLTLSGGYEYRFNKTFSLSAEPYLKLPLTGIGFGKVKLSSAGVLFSANLRPFH